MSQVERVRQAIQQRKKKRMSQVPVEGTYHVQRPFGNIQDEEKYGFRPFPEDLFRNRNQEKSVMKKVNKKKSSSSLIAKFVLSSALFFTSAVLLNTNVMKDKGLPGWLHTQLTEDMPFAKMTAWYEGNFGAPLALLDNQVPSTKPVSKMNGESALPVSGDVSETFQSNGMGIHIAPEGTATVHAANDGVVVFNGNDDQTKKTVVVQHADGSKSTYGKLSTINVHLYEHVRKDEVIGDFTASDEAREVFFSIEKNNEFIDPVSVEPVSGKKSD